MATNMRGDFVYMIVEREFLRLHPSRKAFKIGKSSTLLNRMRQYPKGSQVLTCVHVVNADAAERALLAVFDAAFKRRTDVGREYFAGDPVAMQRLFWSVLDTKGFLTCGHEHGDADEEDVVEDDDVMEDVADDSSPPSSVVCTQPVATDVGPQYDVSGGLEALTYEADEATEEVEAVPSAFHTRDTHYLVSAFVNENRAQFSGAVVKAMDLFQDACVWVASHAPGIVLSFKTLRSTLRQAFGARSTSHVFGSGEMCEAFVFPVLVQAPSTMGLVRRFMMLGPNDPEAVVDDDGRIVYTTRDPQGRSTSVAFLTRAYHAFLARHHRDVKTPDRMTKESLAAAGFVVDKDINTCKACGKSGGRQCCDAYDRIDRTKCAAVRGVMISPSGL
jgi:hypothetical protein